MTAEATTTTTVEPPPTPWDVNDDGTVDIRDLVLVAGQLGESGEGLKGDINGDGRVNIQDLVIVASHLGEDTSN
jgi:Ca2+-binding EF-hand superfamily protein